MNNPNDVLAQSASPTPQPLASQIPRAFLLGSLALLAAFALPLIDLVRFSFHNELHSHVILIPLVSAYLVWIQRDKLAAISSQARLRSLGFVLLALGGAVLAWYWIDLRSLPEARHQDQLSAEILSFVLLFGGLSACSISAPALRSIAFPLGFLVFMIPMPVVTVDAIEGFLQHQSADMADRLFSLAGMTYFRHETLFQLPGINLQVAPECSGIRSSLALFITSVVAGYLFLRSPVKRGILALAVIPLAILRNGFRVFVLGELCVHVSPKVIDSFIHHRGGPIFFALSLVPFFFLLYLLVRYDRRKPAATSPRPV
jgi:exosortase C (VPDSG-CTERM-specific)